MGACLEGAIGEEGMVRREGGREKERGEGEREEEKMQSHTLFLF